MFESVTGQNMATIGGYSAMAVLATMGAVKFFNWVQAKSRSLNELSLQLGNRKLTLMAEVIGYVASRDWGGAVARIVEIIRRIREDPKVLDEMLKPHWLESLELRVQDQECVEAFEARLKAYRLSVAVKAERTLADAKTTAT